MGSESAHFGYGRNAPGFAAAIVLLAALTLGYGCKNSAKSDSEPAVASSAVKSTADNDTGEQRAAKPAPTPEGKTDGGSCAHDRECGQVERCIENTCVKPPAITGELRPDTPAVTFERDGDEVAAFHVEIADDEWERSRGLMFRRSMKDDWGMLFIYPGENIHSFWMKNTYIPLDMVFIGADGRVVGVVEGAEPLTLDPRGVGRPSRYVLELNAGRAKEVGIERGVMMRIDNVPDSAKPKPP